MGWGLGVMVAGVLALPARSPDESAVERALPLLQKSSLQWFEKRSCISCHHQSLATMTFELVRERGFALRDEPEAVHARVVRSLQAVRGSILQGDAGINAQIGQSYKLLGLAAAGCPADRHTDARAFFLAGKQQPDGRWASESRRPPLEDSDFTATALALRVLQLYPLPGREHELGERVARARRWLEQATPRDSEERVMRLFGLAWSGAAPEVVTAAATAVQHEQREDGGFAQLATLASDAYATGQSLLALAQVGGVATSDAAWQRGADFLRRTQLEDGTWRVTTRRRGEGLAYFETGFPHEEDQFISFAASCYATSALCLAERPGRSPIWTAVAPRPRAAVAPLAIGEAPLTPLIEAVVRLDRAEVRRLLAAGADLDETGANGLTPVMVAIADAELTKVLLDAGAAVDSRGETGRTPLTLAAGYDGALPVMELLLQAGAEIEARDATGATPLIAAVVSGDRRKVALLLEQGAAVDNADRDGVTPLRFATFTGDAAMVGFLLEKGAAIDEKNTEGETALIVATADGRDAVVDLLLAEGAAVDARAADGNDALHWAAAVDRGDSHVVEQLLAHGADFTALNNEGRTPLAEALHYGNHHHAERLRKAGAKE